METTLYNAKGAPAGSMKLPEALFGVKWNADLMHQVTVSMQSNARAGTADTKGRGEVRGGGKKPWKQKGTGQARHGSIRSPIWKGGGVTHGPLSAKNYTKKINIKVKQKAFAMALSAKAAAGELLLVEDVSVTTPKTKNAAALLGALSKVKGFEKLSQKRTRALLTLPAHDAPTQKSFRNLAVVRVEAVADMSPVDVLAYKYLIITNPEAAFKALTKRIGK